MAEARHELGQRCASRGGAYRAHVPQVVESQILAIGLPAGPLPYLVQRSPGHVLGRITAAGNSGSSRPVTAWSRRCAFTIGMRCGGMLTVRLPASAFGPLTFVPAFVDTTPPLTENTESTSCGEFG